MNAINKKIWFSSIPKRKKQPYKEPVFLFTSCSLRKAAWAGWYSAFGDEENAENFIHEAHSDWAKEIEASRKFSFFNRHNNDIWKYIPDKKLAEIHNIFIKSLKEEIGKAKKKYETKNPA